METFTKENILMKTETSIPEAIARSVTHNEIVRVTFSGTLDEALGEVSDLAEDYDYATENNGDEDVWGTTDDGDEFRIRITLA